ncbi:MAG: VTT domain-containing protein [Acidobacteria bacterium]|nr:VTT domain-containing protein [Acidobacteriota bacterium]
MSELETFLRDYGLWALFFFAAFEGDLTLLLTGVLVHLGIWRPAEALAVGTAGGLAGDSFYFWLGHGTARRWLTTAHGQRVLPRIERAAQRYGVFSLFFARYVYGARIATMFFWGMRRIPYRKFFALDALNCLIWCSVFGGLGYIFANSLERLIGELRRVESWLLLGLLVFALLLGLRHYLAELGRIREEATKETEP